MFWQEYTICVLSPPLTSTANIIRFESWRQSACSKGVLYIVYKSTHAATFAEEEPLLGQYSEIGPISIPLDEVRNKDNVRSDRALKRE